MADPRLGYFLHGGQCAVDLGCGAGEIIRDVSDKYDIPIGIDRSRRRLLAAGDATTRPWLFLISDLDHDVPLQDNIADIVIANQFIEHLIDPFHFAREVFRILKPGGRIVITTPNIRYLRHLISMLIFGLGPRTGGGNTLDGAWDNGHLHYFTHRDLHELFHNAGFSISGSKALIDISRGGLIRRWLDRWAGSYLVRELLSGNILFWAIK